MQRILLLLCVIIIFQVRNVCKKIKETHAYVLPQDIQYFATTYFVLEGKSGFYCNSNKFAKCQYFHVISKKCNTSKIECSSFFVIKVSRKVEPSQYTVIPSLNEPQGNLQMVFRKVFNYFFACCTFSKGTFLYN